MKKDPQVIHRLLRVGWAVRMAVWIGVVFCFGEAWAGVENPISKVARWVNPELARMEDRQKWLEERIQTMAAFQEHPLRAGLGARGHREDSGGPDPEVIIDLRDVRSIERIYFVPTQREYIGDGGVFPRLFTLEVAESADFADARMIFTTDGTEFANPDGTPVLFNALHTPGRYVRMTVHRGHHNKGWLDKFGLSEILVTERGKVVSFGAPVRMTGALNSGTLWYPEALTDGRMPHGIWHAGLTSNDRGDATLVTQGSERICWHLDLGEVMDLERLVLFPYKMTDSVESSLMPNRMNVDVRDCAGDEWRTVTVWSNRPASAACHTPKVLCMYGERARHIRLRALEPWELGELRIQGLSEIQVWVDGENVALGLPVRRIRGAVTVKTQSLTNGFTSDYLIAEVPVWLDQLRDRMKFEAELNDLRPRIQAMAEDSELNVSLASAILVGMTFLIPVFLYEKRRVKARQRMEGMRRRIAADLHDDVGGNLGSISLIACAARKQVEELAAPEDLVHDLEEVESIARESSQAMRDIVWLMELRDDSVGDLVERMKETTGRMLRGITHELDCRSRRTGTKLSLYFKRNFYLFFKETLHNIQKHSSARHVAIVLDDDGDFLELRIEDDGCGMDASRLARRHTLCKLKERAEAVAGELRIDSEPGKGTRLVLRVPSKSLNFSPDPT